MSFRRQRSVPLGGRYRQVSLYRKKGLIPYKCENIMFISKGNSVVGMDCGSSTMETQSLIKHDQGFISSTIFHSPVHQIKGSNTILYSNIWPKDFYKILIWVRSWNCGCLVTWFCYQLIAKPGNKTAAVLWPDPYVEFYTELVENLEKVGCEQTKISDFNYGWKLWVKWPPACEHTVT